MATYDIAAVCASVLVLAAYHLWLLRRISAAPATTWFGQTAAARAGWVATVVKGGHDILAVQTLRNWIMGASLLASTAAVVVLGLLGLILNANGFPRFVDELNLLGSTSPSVTAVKLLVLVTCLLFAFVNFTMAIRYYNHVGFDINVAPDTPGTLGPAGVTRLLHRAALHYTLGMRGYYLTMIAVLWLFGPVWMLIGALLATLAWLRMERAVS